MSTDTRVMDEQFEREVGAALLGWIAATRLGRWRGPRGALDYVEVPDGTPEALVRDFIAWSSGYSDHLALGARERMEQLGDEVAPTLLLGVGSISRDERDRAAS